MSPIGYYQLIKNMQNPFDLQLKMVQYAFSHSKSEAARVFNTTRDTVKKWVERYTIHGTKGLINDCRAPKSIPHKIKKPLEDKILCLRDQFPTMGQDKLKLQFDLPCSTWTINRVLKQNNRIKPRKKKYQRARDLRELKAKYKPLEKLQIDVKEITDIPELYLSIKRHNLPLYQYTARCIRTGASFISYAYEQSLTNSTTFARYVLTHLKEIGIMPRVVQTDNGSEFIGSYQSKAPSIFTKTLTCDFPVEHRRIPPGAKTYNSDVEAQHRLIEEEFYKIEPINSENEFLQKAYTYNLYFNYLRKNSYKWGKTPYEILNENLCPKYKKLLSLPPIVLDYFMPAKADDDVPYEYHTEKSTLDK